jgi:hypothetical protein
LPATTRYQEVFANYWQILDEINAASGEVVLEFGSGTGNLTEKLVVAGKTVYLQYLPVISENFLILRISAIHFIVVDHCPLLKDRHK